MIGRIVEIAEDNRYLSAHRGFMVISESTGERNTLGQVPLDDVSAVIANAHGLSYSNNLLVHLAQRGAPFVLCAANHQPVGLLLAIEGNFEQARRMDAQLSIKRPLRKQLWAAIVRSKLEQQAAVLEAVGAPAAPLWALSKKVRSGDPHNLEAQGARRYWGLLLGKDFRRDQSASGLNSLLNYGYTILRAATARSVVAAGLHPSLGIHHSNAGNAMRLADDLIEPFRPAIDLKVWQLKQSGQEEITPATKRALVQTLYDDMLTGLGATPITVCTQRLAVSLAQVCLGDRTQLDLPLAGLPISMAAALPST